MSVTQWCCPKTLARGAVLKEVYGPHPYPHQNCIFDDKGLVKPVYVKVLKEGESKL